MRVLLGVHQFFPKYYTGTERYVLNLARQLQRLGHYVKVLTYGFGDEIGFKEGASSNILYKEYDFEGVPVVSIRHKQQADDLSFVLDFLDIDVYSEVKRIIEQDEFDLYHCAHPLRIASSIKAAKDVGIKVVFMVTDYFMMCPMGIMLRKDNSLCDGPDNGRNCLKYCFTHVKGERMQARISDAYSLINCCDQLLSPSRFLVEAFNYTGFIDRNSFILSRHGFDYAKKKISLQKELREPLIFGYIGTVQYHKGVHIMVKSFRKTRYNNIELHVWGGCMHEVEYKKSVIKIAKGDPRIKFRGVYDFNDIETVLSEIDIVIVPSIWYENAPLTITTSLAYGIPVITSNIGGMSEFIKDGHNGYTFKVGNQRDLTKKIALIAENPEILDTFRKNIQYPIRIEEEAFNTEMVYKRLLMRNIES